MKLKILPKKISTIENGIFYKEIANEKGKIVDKIFIVRFRESNKDKLLTIGKYSAGIRLAFCKQKRDEILTKIRLGEDIPIKHKRRKIYTLNDAFEPYLIWSKNNKKSWKNNDEQPYNKHIRPILGDRELISLTPKDFEEIKQIKLKEGYQPKTVHLILGMVRHLINYSINNELIKNYVNPIANGRVKMPKVDNAKMGYLSKSQAKDLLDILKSRKHLLAYNLTMILLNTGGRFSEVTSLRWYDVNFETKLIFFNTSKDGEPRHIYISDSLMELLKELKLEAKSKNDFVVPSTKGTQVMQMPRQWQLIVDKLIPNNVNAKKYRITVHSLRHTHASWLAIAGMNILEIKEQLGHRKLDMTLRYSHLIPSQRHKKTEIVFNEL